MRLTNLLLCLLPLLVASGAATADQSYKTIVVNPALKNNLSAAQLISQQQDQPPSEPPQELPLGDSSFCLERATAFSRDNHNLADIENYLNAVPPVIQGVAMTYVPSHIRCPWHLVSQSDASDAGAYLGVGESRDNSVSLLVSSGPAQPTTNDGGSSSDQPEEAQAADTPIVETPPPPIVLFWGIRVLAVLVLGLLIFSIIKWRKRRVRSSAPLQVTLTSIRSMGTPTLSIDDTHSITFSVDVTCVPIRPPSIEEKRP